MASKDDPRCHGCPLYDLGTGFVRGEGAFDLGVLVVAEALGKEEVDAGRPLVGPAGRVWDRIVSRTRDDGLNRNLRREDFYRANVVCCRPPDNVLTGAWYAPRAIDCCTPYLDETIRNLRPKSILALGDTALQKLTGHSGITKLRGYIFDTPYGPVVPTYHPSYIMRGNFHLARVVQTDILKALRVAREGTAVFAKPKEYNARPSVADAMAFLENWRSVGRPPVAFDIETPKGSDKKDDELYYEEDESYTILMCSFSFEGYRAISLPWMPPYTDVAQAILREAGMSLVWNAKFDVPRLSAAGVEFGGTVVDAMIAWHWLEPAMPMGLKYVATFLCVTPDTPILTRDLRWIPAGTLEKGTELLSLDEERPKDAMGRRFREAVVTSTKEDFAEVFEVVFSDGTSVKTTAEHPWLKRCRGSLYEWVPTSRLRVGQKLRRVLDVWTEDISKAGGWLAGMYDGEGSLSYGKRSTKKLGIAQVVGDTAERIRKELLDRGFTPYYKNVATTHQPQERFVIQDTPEILRLLGTIRPERLLRKLDVEKLGEVRSRKTMEVSVVKINELGVQKIQRIETSTHTYFAAGFAMHNCPDMSAWALEKEEKGLAWYNCADSDVLLRSYQEIRARLEKQGRWSTFERHFLEFGQYLQKLTNRGIKIDVAAQRQGLEYFSARLEQTASDIQQFVPVEAKPLHPKKGYKKTEAQLRKSGSWEEGKMKLTAVAVSEEEYDKHVAAEAKRVEREAKKAAKLSKPPRKKRSKMPVLPGLGLDPQ